MAHVPDSLSTMSIQVMTIRTSKDASSSATPTSAPTNVINADIEHMLVEDDPRLWSNTRKSIVLFIISGASIIAGLCTNIQNPANYQIQQELHTTASRISLSLSFFILIQGNFPIVWSAVSEVEGRKFVYMLSITLFVVSSAIVAISKTINLVIGMRAIQAVGSSAVITIGTATLADIYDSHQRGTKIGIYYSAPFLGMASASLLGGGLTQGSSWRAVFWFLATLGGVIFLAFLFLFRETFRQERSATYQNTLKRRMREQERKSAQRVDVVERDTPVGDERVLEDSPVEAQSSKSDVEAQPIAAPTLAIKQVKLSLVDVNPFPLYLRVLRRRNNLAIVATAGLLYAFSFGIAYACGRTLSLYYNYDAITIGLVQLAFGTGSVLGSTLGGRWCDRTLAQLKAANGGVSYPEMRLESIKPVMWLFPPAVTGYAWVCQRRVHISAVCATLFLSGFCVTWIYSSLLAYIVDANVGQSSSVVATVSSFRGTSAFVAAEIAVPIQDTIGDGGLFTLWAGLILFAELTILLVLYKGKHWREASVNAEMRRHAT